MQNADDIRPQFGKRTHKRYAEIAGLQIFVRLCIAGFNRAADLRSAIVIRRIADNDKRRVFRDIKLLPRNILQSVRAKHRGMRIVRARFRRRFGINVASDYRMVAFADSQKTSVAASAV